MTTATFFATETSDFKECARLTTDIKIMGMEATVSNPEQIDSTKVRGVDPRGKLVTYYMHHVPASKAIAMWNEAKEAVDYRKTQLDNAQRAGMPFACCF